MDFELFLLSERDKSELLNLLQHLCDILLKKQINNPNINKMKRKAQWLYNELIQLSIEDNDDDVNFINTQYHSNYNVCINIHVFHKCFDESIMFMFNIISVLCAYSKFKQFLLMSESGKIILLVVNGIIKCYEHEDYKYPFDIITNS